MQNDLGFQPGVYQEMLNAAVVADSRYEGCQIFVAVDLIRPQPTFDADGNPV